MDTVSNHNRLAGGAVPPSPRRARDGDRSAFQTQTYPVENAILEIDLNAPRNVLDLFSMIDLAEVDANLVKRVRSVLLVSRFV